MSATDTPVPEATRVEALLHAAQTAASEASMCMHDVIDEHIIGGSDEPLAFEDAAKVLGMAVYARRHAAFAVDTANELIEELFKVYVISSEGYTFPTIEGTGGPN